MAEYGLELHSEKTRLIEFGRFAQANRKRNGAGKPETFHFLGFTHICGTIHNGGNFTLMRKTVGKRMTAKLRNNAEELRRLINDSIEQTGNWLTQVLRGYFNYHAVPGNLRRLGTFRKETARNWFPEAAQSAQPTDVGALLCSDRPVSTRTGNSASSPAGTVLRQTSR